MTDEERQLLTEGVKFRVSEASIERHDIALAEGINKTVGKRDTLWMLGDFCYGRWKTYLESCRRYRDMLNCQNICLIWGNHDKGEIGKFFEETYDLRRIKIEGQVIVLCHTAFAIWVDSHKGAWNLYGHSHSGAEAWLDQIMSNRRSMDVGVDNAAKVLGEYRPFSFPELKDIMSKKSGHHSHQTKEKGQRITQGNVNG